MVEPLAELILVPFFGQYYHLTTSEERVTRATLRRLEYVGFA